MAGKARAKQKAYNLFCCFALSVMPGPLPVIPVDLCQRGHCDSQACHGLAPPELWWASMEPPEQRQHPALCMAGSVGCLPPYIAASPQSGGPLWARPAVQSPAPAGLPCARMRHGGPAGGMTAHAPAGPGTPHGSHLCQWQLGTCRMAEQQVPAHPAASLQCPLRVA